MRFKIIVGRQNLRTDKFFLQYRHKVQQIFRIAVSDVINAVRRQRQPVPAVSLFGRTLHDTPDSLHDIVHIGEVPLAVSVVEDLYRLAFQKLIRKAKVRHIRSAGRTVDRKEAQSGGRNIIELGIGVSKKLVGLFRCRIERHRIIHFVVG